MSKPPAVKKPALPAKPGKFTDELFTRVLANILEGENTHPAIEREGISFQYFYQCLQKQPELAPLLQEAQLERDKARNVRRIEEAERELHRRGVDGWEEPVFDIKGNHCGNKRRYSDACLIFMLKSLKPEVFADKPQALIQNNVTITQKEEREILADWRQRLGAAPER